MKRILFALTLTASALVLALGQTQSPTAAGQQSDVNVTVTTAEVLLDTVVRDKKGRVVKNLTISDFEVYEDGVRQDLKSSRFVTDDAGAAGNSGAVKPDVTSSESATPPAEPVRSPAKVGARPATNISALALVFDRLTPDGRARSRQVALDYVGKQMKHEGLIGVFLTGLSLEVMQPYTTDLQLVKQGIDRAGSRSPALYTSNNEEARKVREYLARRLDKEGELAARDPAVIVAFMQIKALDSWETLQRNQQGYATTNGLLAVADSLAETDGRKAIIFFSEGFAIPPDVQAHFRSVIGHANRAGVTIYTVDAAGLRAESTQAETRKEIESRSSLRMATLGLEDKLPLGLMMKGLERNEDLLHLDPHSGLGQLADQTGGFLVRDTNDLGSGLRRIDEDMTAYYLLSYTPKDQSNDGRFRQVEVRLKRSGLDVQSRKGYFAINGSFASPVLSYEAPALAIAGSDRRPSDLVVRTAALSFPERLRPGLVPIAVEVPARFVTFATDPQKNSCRTDFSIVVLIKDGKQQVVRKLSSQYVLGGALDKMEAARQSDVLFYRETELEPGLYTVETIVHDALGNKAGWHQSSLEVSVVDEARPRLSSIMMVKRTEKLSAGERKDFHPLHFGELLLYPSVGEPFQKSAAKEIPFFFTAYGTGAGSSKFVAELTKDGRLVGKTANNLPGADAQGRVQYASAFPSENFEPGEYELSITLTAAQGSSSRSTRFTVEP